MDPGGEWGCCHGYYQCHDCWDEHEHGGCTRPDCPFNVIRAEEAAEAAAAEAAAAPQDGDDEGASLPPILSCRYDFLWYVYLTYDSC